MKGLFQGGLPYHTDSSLGEVRRESGLDGVVACVLAPSPCKEFS